MWQDYAMSGILILFVVALIPQIVKIIRYKSATDFSYQTCILTIFGGLAMAIVVLSLKMYFSFIINLVQALSWITIAFLKYYYTQKPDDVFDPNWRQKRWPRVI